MKNVREYQRKSKNCERERKSKRKKECLRSRKSKRRRAGECLCVCV